jgi:hypothetical protein
MSTADASLTEMRELWKHFDLNNSEGAGMKITCDNPDEGYFIELQRVSNNQIVWGENFYGNRLGPGRIVWDKMNDCVQLRK